MPGNGKVFISHAHEDRVRCGVIGSSGAEVVFTDFTVSSAG